MASLFHPVSSGDASTHYRLTEVKRADVKAVQIFEKRTRDLYILPVGLTASAADGDLGKPAPAGSEHYICHSSHFSGQRDGDL